MPQTISLPLAVAEKAMREFRNQWLSGLQPVLSLETASDGQLHVLFKVVAGYVTVQNDGGQHREHVRGQAGKAQQQQPRRRSPSYRQRLLRRAAARAASAEALVMKRSTAEKFVQTGDEYQLEPPPHHPVRPCMLAVEAEHLSRHHPHDLPLDEVCPDQTYAESLPSTIAQLDGHDDTHVNSEINVDAFVDIINNQEKERRRHAENARLERETDLDNFRKLMNQTFV